MADFEKREYKVFELFQKQWAVVTAGTPEKYNACTVSWGSLGTIWTRPDTAGSIVTVYLHPARYTNEIMRESETFTVSFFPQQYRRGVAWLGSHSGRDGDKIAASGLTPIPAGDGVTFREAELSFVCKKLYQHQFAKEDLAPEIQAYYAANPKAYPVDEHGDWQPHWVFVGEILETIEN